MPFVVIYEASQKEVETCVSDDVTALRLATSFEVQGLHGVTIQDLASGEIYSPLAFRLLRTDAAVTESNLGKIPEPPVIGRP